MGRHICTNLPISTAFLKPEWLDLQAFCRQDYSYKGKMKKRYDRRHCAKELPISDD